ncbi:hypothetical protein GGP91_002862 [Salinibacter ruber]|uniref:hypothetical protein n=1 Tax=Salinibacter ruber TaxID=146919 RepID=UPI0020739C03|nr:hypothetical protein [Salinibacter ruber]MCS3830768.1 hypothetical protein [Salinibacter ruber]MCS4048975.1 hypothetical protein [Salinibacter ruber]MCS4057408.1 hypothetical protein [Salinibacter ruber]MCS4060886.1 hypothetical protein [Salinibacter ruber]MCS4103284.1 hypothetical protein [Salinibacter ruber]
MTGSFPRERSFSRENSLVVASLVVARSLVARSLVVRRLVLLCVAALFAVVALFAAATLQPAIAQDDSSHEVTIEVDPVQKLTIENDVGPVTVSELSYPGESGLNFDEDGESTTGTFEIRTNLTGQKVTAEVINGGSQGQIRELGLQVSLTSLDGGETVFGYQTLLQPADTDPGAETVAENIGQTKTDGLLKYRAAATPEFDPNSDATVQVQYTLTGSTP